MNELTHLVGALESAAISAAWLVGWASLVLAMGILL